jgi:dTDP-4-dehydrorhamnose reductase
VSAVDRERWLVVGAGGQVGGALLEQLGPMYATGTARRADASLHLDLCETGRFAAHAALVLDTAAPGVVVVAAGMTNVDGCETDPAQARQANCDAPAVLAGLVRERGAQTVYLSTEYVFDGREGPYDENARTHPLSVYGRTKLDGELAVTAADPGALIVRTTVVYGPEEQGKNFAYRLAAHLREGRRLRVPRDQVSTPTYNRDLAAAIVELATEGRTGIVHVSGPEQMSRDDLARALAVAAGLDSTLIDAVATVQLGQAAPRPLQAGLVSCCPPKCTRHTVQEAVFDWQARPRGRAWP